MPASKKSKRKSLNVHPGELLREEFLAPLGITPSRLATVTNLPRQCINELISGRRRITAEIDLRLSSRFGQAPGYWLRVQAAYDSRDMAKKSATKRPGRGAARTMGEALGLLEADFSRGKTTGPMAALGHARKLRGGPARSTDSAMEELRAGEAPEAHVPRNNAKAIQAVLAARQKEPRVFQSDAESIMWMLAPHDDLGGKAPLDAIFGGDWSKRPTPAAAPPQLVNSPLTDSEIMLASMSREITSSDLQRYTARALRAVACGNDFIVTAGGKPWAVLTSLYPTASTIAAVSKAYEAGLVPRIALRDLSPVRR